MLVTFHLPQKDVSSLLGSATPLGLKFSYLCNDLSIGARANFTYPKIEVKIDNLVLLAEVQKHSNFNRIKILGIVLFQAFFIWQRP